MNDRPLIFGTDGIRDRAGEGYLSHESVRRLVKAISKALSQRREYRDEIPDCRGDTVYIARDTRASGQDLFDQVASEFQCEGFPVGDLGVLPTGGAAHAATNSEECCLSIVISASHNPAAYNGIKLLAPVGAKISRRFENVVSDFFYETNGTAGATTPRAPRKDLGRETAAEYVRFLVERSWHPERLVGKKVVIDAANGAAHEVAPAVFRQLGMTVECLGVEPDGTNINDGCGALHPESIARRLREDDAIMGFCFDGDADRMIPVTSSGKILDGDYVMALAGRGYRKRGRLPLETVVATVMSNIGLEKSLAREGLKLLRTPVGDRYVYREMAENGHAFGGEQSGHLIFMDDFRTGDGILAAIRLLDVLESDDLDLDREAGIMIRYPQVLRNVEVSEKLPLEEIPAVASSIKSVEERLSGEGRVLVRYSGTEPLARVMLEGPDRSTIETMCDEICCAIRASLPA